MKTNRFYYLFVIAFALINIFNISNAYVKNSINTEYSKLLNELLKKRVSIINDYLYNNREYSFTKEKLRSIEREELLKEDLEILKYIKNNPTDFPYVRDLNIENIEKSEIDRNRLRFTVLIRWYISYNEEEKQEKGYYEVDLVKLGNSIYITGFTNIQSL